MAEPYRADQVGSLLRPPDLLRARDDVESGRLSAGGLRASEDRAILTALEMQHAVGIDVLCDGELRRRAWMTDLAEAVDGFTPAHISIEWQGPDGGAEGSFAQVVGERLQQRRRLTAHESAFLAQHAGGPFKMTVPAPSNFMGVGFRRGLTDRFYPTPQDLAAHIAEIIRDELQALAKEGVAYLQLDAPYYCNYMDPRLRDQLRASGIDPDRALADAIAADNAALEGIRREGVTTAIHICRGNSRSRWLASGGYGAIAEQLFGSLDVDRFLLEYDDERSGGFEPLRFVPRGRTVVLGLITTKSGRLETVDALRRRIDEAAQFISIDNLAISPQCGFASVAAGNRISMDEQKRKMELVVETAHNVWG
jgi:5-methyltetrahydropteroyltriglutamate--homocysteine methyltransferase